jgi:hypothetical protein
MYFRTCLRCMKLIKCKDNVQIAFKTHLESLSSYAEY